MGAGAPCSSPHAVRENPVCTPTFIGKNMSTGQGRGGTQGARGPETVAEADTRRHCSPEWALLSEGIANV